MWVSPMLESRSSSLLKTLKYTFIDHHLTISTGSCTRLVLNQAIGADGLLNTPLMLLRGCVLVISIARCLLQGTAFST
jgi:hypothetical protein